MADFEKQLRDYRLTTAEILYHMPDHPALLQTYVWQDYDMAPRFPVLQQFLDFWESSLDGRLHSVKVASTEIITPSDMRFTEALKTLH
ncbi:usg protein [Ferruginivarius sediminum]|uniref:Usg family protein n=1 Tax=Ferruginivarius sediminum TaxID=2661937 RepID=A0A369TBI3_9PROT|nr:Usg family protein [Ferruginivarius sediminum]RDD61874.1 Usg family protein [Ferruginivarius sediminum]